MGPATKPRLLISQADNFSAQFGHVLRSSALFWALHDEKVKTTISFSNYWKFKNATEVAVIVNVRDMAGVLLKRETVSFQASEVCNFVPPEGFEGSIEVEVFAIANLRIPYAAIMAIYETAEAISMVHAYARAYSQHEVEEGRTICVGEESCWTLRDDHELTSFAIFHNGSVAHPRQTANLRVRNLAGFERLAAIKLPALRPFQTVIVEPAAYFPDLAQFLGGEPGNARLSFTLGRAFTRMLCGVRRKDWRQLQVTHSNFDYSAHDTDTITEGHRVAYLHAPQLPSGRSLELVVYPDTNPGEYLARYGNVETAFATGDIVRLPQTERRPIAFRRKDGILPSRIVVGWTLKGPQRVVPAECSVGVVHHRQPPKHSAWMVVSQVFGSLVTWIDYAEVYGGCPDDATWDCMLYAANRKEPYRETLVYGTIAREPFLTLERIFGPAIDLGGTFGCLSLRSSYGGLWMFSTLQKNDALTLEHSF